MKRKILLLLLAMSSFNALLLAPAQAQTAIGASFTYQGRLSSGGTPQNGAFDFNFLLFDAAGAGNPPSGGNQVGPMAIANNVSVVDGLFTVRIDFGANSFNSNARWLEIRVSPAGSNAFTTLIPRSRLTAAPAATYAVNANQAASAQTAVTATSAISAGTATNALSAITATTATNAINATNAATASSALSVAANGVNSAAIASGAVQRQHFASGLRNTLDASDGDPAGAVYVNPGGSVGVGTTSPSALLHVHATNTYQLATFESSNPSGSWLTLRNTGSTITDWSLITTGSGNGEGVGKLLVRDSSTVRMTFDINGNVGVGTSSAGSKLEVNGGVRARGGTPGLNGANNNGYTFNGNDGDTDTGMFSSGTGSLEFYSDASERMRIQNNGHVGIGTPTPETRLHVRNTSDHNVATFEGSSTVGTWLRLKNTGGGTEWRFISTGSANGEGANKLLIGTSAGTNTVEIAGNIGAKVVEIYGGSDIAEPFNINTPETEVTSTIQPGMVVCIDPDKPGELRLAMRAYDKTVAGIVSGAGGVNPGVMLRQRDSIADGKHPVALTGRVYCLVDADAGGPVKPGDLLTTSNVPGHAMRVKNHKRAAGAIIGKAMSPLQKGKGLVYVLVSLQ